MPQLASSLKKKPLFRYNSSLVCHQVGSLMDGIEACLYQAAIAFSLLQPQDHKHFVTASQRAGDFFLF